MDVANKLLAKRQKVLDQGATALAPGHIGEQVLDCLSRGQELSLISLLTALEETAAGGGTEALKAKAAIELIKQKSA